MSEEKNSKFGLSPHAGSHGSSEEQMGLLIDPVKCVGCMTCFMACKEINGFPNNDDKELNDKTYTVVKKVGTRFVRRLCMHCLNPACVSVCPVGALQKTAKGPVIYDEDRCIGCRYCMVACPFSIPAYEWHSVTPKVQKCFMCYEKRVSKGLQTACAEACSYGATTYGKRSDLIIEAHERIEKNPDKYLPHLYGETELGGTSTMYMAGIPFENIDFLPEFRNDPLPVLTWNVLNRLPDIVVMAGVLMSGFVWIINRRMELSKSKKHTTSNNVPDSSDDKGDKV